MRPLLRSADEEAGEVPQGHSDPATVEELHPQELVVAPGACRRRLSHGPTTVPDHLNS